MSRFDGVWHPDDGTDGDIELKKRSIDNHQARIEGPYVPKYIARDIDIACDNFWKRRGIKPPETFFTKGKQ